MPAQTSLVPEPSRLNSVAARCEFRHPSDCTQHQHHDKRIHDHREVQGDKIPRLRCPLQGVSKIVGADHAWNKPRQQLAYSLARLIREVKEREAGFRGCAAWIAFSRLEKDVPCN